ncbi:MAG: hypothetical protein N3A02_00290 [Rectinema sp.]|nr:hypothetical protein [Rectinema sp.]
MHTIATAPADALAGHLLSAITRELHPRVQAVLVVPKELDKIVVLTCGALDPPVDRDDILASLEEHWSENPGERVLYAVARRASDVPLSGDSPPNAFVVGVRADRMLHLSVWDGQRFLRDISANTEEWEGCAYNVCLVDESGTPLVRL